VTTGLLEILNRDELQGVIAHEIAHINNRDSLTMMTMACMLGSIIILRDVGLRVMRFGGGRSRSRSSGGGQAQLIILAIALVLMILAPIFAQLLYFATSRRREYLADACGALYTRYPPGLAMALQKIGSSTQTFKPASSAFLPFYIIRPFNGMRHKLDDLSSTHPSTEKRIKILMGMTQGAGLPEYHRSFYTVMKSGLGTASLLKTKQDNPAIRSQLRDEDSGISKHREALNAVWAGQGYKAIACDCGTTLKIPPRIFTGKAIACPHCGASHCCTVETR
jgi:heat shock protein HtpX